MGIVIGVLVVLAGLAALLLVLVALLLVVPIRLDATWSETRRAFAVAGPGLRVGYDAAERTMEVRVLALFGRRWTTQPRPETAAKSRRKAPRKARPSGRRRRGGSVSPRRLWAQRRRALAALATFLRRLRVRRLRIDAVVATPDPALTGWLCGVAFAGRAALPARWRAGVGVRPDFTREYPDLEADASLRLQPLQAALLGLRLWLVLRRARRPRLRTPPAPDHVPNRPSGGERNERP